MKTFKLIVMSLFIAGGLTFCQNDLVNPADENLNSGLKSATTSERMVPFKAVFTSTGADDQFTEACQPPVSATDFWSLDHQVGEGNALHLGKLTFDMTFCFHFVFNEAGMPDFDNGFGESVDGDGFFEAANGDRLYIYSTTSKLFLIPDRPGYAYFDDTFYFNGGTGRFEGAHGEFRAYGVAGGGEPANHVWEGTLILPNAVKSSD